MGSSTYNRFVDTGYGSHDEGHITPASIRRRVLLADDDPAMRELLVESLTEEGFDVMAARDGFELLAYLRASLGSEEMRPPDIVVADIRMPGLNGLDAVRFLRQCRSAIPVVLITAFGDDSVRDRARRLGADVVLDKPIDLDTLRDVVWSLAGG